MFALFLGTGGQFYPSLFFQTWPYPSATANSSVAATIAGASPCSSNATELSFTQPTAVITDPTQMLVGSFSNLKLKFSSFFN